MRLVRSLMIIMVLTLVALLYVHQQVELVKLSYSINYKEKKLKEILDRKESLGYNIANLEDPSRLENILLAKKIDISFPKKDHVFKIAQLTPKIKHEGHLRKIGLERKANIFGILEFLGLSREAQAKEK